jgi:hypothetical protein
MMGAGGDGGGRLGVEGGGGLPHTHEAQQAAGTAAAAAVTDEGLVMHYHELHSYLKLLASCNLQLTFNPDHHKSRQAPATCGPTHSTHNAHVTYICGSKRTQPAVTASAAAISDSCWPTWWKQCLIYHNNAGWLYLGGDGGGGLGVEGGGGLQQKHEAQQAAGTAADEVLHTQQPIHAKL